MSIDLYNRLLKIWESIRTPTPKVGVHLGVWGFIPHILLHSWEYDVIPAFHSWPAPLQALALVISPRLGLRQHVTIVINKMNCG
jgi:hypothetical protein